MSGKMISGILAMIVYDGRQKLLIGLNLFEFTPDGNPDDWKRHAQSCFTGANFICAMTYIYLDRKDEGLAVAKKIIETLFRGPHAMPWGQPCAIDCFTGDTHHGHDYHDPVVLWAIPLALEGHDVRQGVQPGTLVHDILEAAAGR